jgi:hypothetical protein
MKKVIVFTAILAVSALSIDAYGQELKKKEGSNGKWGFVKPTGDVAIPFVYDAVCDFTEGLAAVKNFNGKWGFIDIDHKTVIPHWYDTASPFEGGMAEVMINNSYIIIDKTGKMLPPNEYYEIGSFSDGLANAKLNGKCGFIDKAGKEVISFKYDDVGVFSDGLANVKLNGKWGFIDKTGKEVIPCKYDEIVHNFLNGLARVKFNNTYIFIKEPGEPEILFSTFARIYVEPKMNDLQQKGKYETTDEWQQRVKAKREEYTEEARREYINMKSHELNMTFNIENYDADNSVFLVKSNPFGDLLVPVPRSEAETFETSWNKVTKTPQYTIDNKGMLALAEVAFALPNGKIYRYSNQAYNKSVPIEKEVVPTTPATQPAPNNNQSLNIVKVHADNLNVDLNIPATGAMNGKTFAVIIANENYRREAKVIYAKNDGETFQKYCIQTLGLPKDNVHYIEDATLNDIRSEIDWISNVANAFTGDINIIFYYAGHGIPDESSKTSCLLPVDGYGTNIKSAYRLDDLYQTLGKLPAKSVTLFMDACFSGAQRSGDMMASARGVAIRVTQGSPTGNMVVFSAAQGDETAYPHREKGHGMFTYFLLKKLQETKGEVTLGELSDYITTNVGQQSIVINGKSQTPVVTPSPTISDKWKGMKLK